MRIWLRLLLVLVSVGGGFAGFIAASQSLLLTLQDFKLFNFFAYCLFSCLFGFVTIAGLLFVQDEHRIKPLMISLGLQVPWVSSSLIVYKLASAMHLAFTVGQHEDKIRFGADFFFGSNFGFSLLARNPWHVGVNVVPVALILLVWNSEIAKTSIPKVKVKTEVV